MNPFLELAGIAQPWQEVTLPHDSLIEQDRSPGSVLNGRTGYYPSGAFEYVKTFTAPSGYRDGRVEVQFDGVYRHATVYVNGSFAGHRTSG
jgi:beta-galactosidase